MSELHLLSAVELANMIRSREASSVEVVSAFLDQIDTYNPTFNAVVSLRPRADILKEAEKADRAVAAGEPTGPLHGLPLAVKDLALTKGLPTTYGSPLFAGFVSTIDGLAVSRQREAGGIIIGKTNTPEFGLGSQTYNTVFGATRNAYDASRTAGGSSGGAAAALALRMLPVADGSDLGGSLRNPGAYNNLLGLRPSQGRVPAHPSLDLYYSQISTDGPMARSIADLTLLLSVMAGPDPRVPLSLETPFVPHADPIQAARGCRIAWLGDLAGHLPFEPGILDLCETALRSLEGAGCKVEAVVPKFDYEALWRAFVVLRHYHVCIRLKPLYLDPAKRSKLKPEAIWEMEGYISLSADELAVASQVRSAWFGVLAQLFEQYDYFVLPSAQVFPFDVEQHWPKEIAGTKMDSYHRWMEVVTPVTLSGCPALNVPVGFRNGLPMGMQIVGRPRRDDDVLALGALYETLTPWQTYLPNVLGASTEPKSKAL